MRMEQTDKNKIALYLFNNIKSYKKALVFAIECFIIMLKI